jgi:micrococcal nuclease
MFIPKKRASPPPHIKAIIKAICLATTLIASTILTSSSIANLNASPQTTTSSARVISVIDGDTIIVEVNKTVKHLRLIGIDTPETKPNRRATIQAQEQNLDRREIYKLGARAANFTRQLLPKNTPILIERDVTKRDKYGRLLGYVWKKETIPSGENIMINEEIVRAGYASILTIPPNVKYHERLLKAFRDARLNRRGLWSKG